MPVYCVPEDLPVDRSRSSPGGRHTAAARRTPPPPPAGWRSCPGPVWPPLAGIWPGHAVAPWRGGQRTGWGGRSLL